MMHFMSLNEIKTYELQIQRHCYIKSTRTNLQEDDFGERFFQGRVLPMTNIISTLNGMTENCPVTVHIFSFADDITKDLAVKNSEEYIPWQ